MQKPQLERLLSQSEQAFHTGDFEAAEKYAVEASDLNHKSPEALNNLGVIHFQKGEIQKAINQFENALSHKPGHVDALLNLASAYHHTGNVAAAFCVLLQGFVNQAPPSEVLDSLQLLAAHLFELFAEGRKFPFVEDQKVKNILLEFGKKFPSAFEVKNQTGQEIYAASLLLLRKYDLAEKVFRSIISEYQGSDIHTFILKRLENIERAQQAGSPAKYRIGFVSLWYERGQAYVTKTFRNALDVYFDTFVLARTEIRGADSYINTEGEWDVPRLTIYPEYKIPADHLVRWIRENSLDVVFFNEEYDFGLVEAAKRAGALTVGYYVWELFNPRWGAKVRSIFDIIICPTKSCYQRFREYGLDTATYLRWPIDRQHFFPIEKQPSDRIQFFHPAGWGGLHARRGTQFVIDAFEMAGLKNAELLIHTQHGEGVENHGNIVIAKGTVPREDLIAMYQNADVAVLPSKWEGLGLTFLEALGCGLPIITVNAPPMNEFVKDGQTGFLCKVGGYKVYPNIFVPAWLVNIEDMAEKMRMVCNNELREKMATRAIARAEKFSLNEFQEKLACLLEETISRVKQGLRLNVACGQDIRSGYINIDQRQLPGVDIVGDVANLPYKDETISEILANDIVEHFPHRQSEEVLKEWVRILAPEGILKLQSPNIRALAASLVRNEISSSEFARRIYGGQTYEGNFHFSGFDIPSMKRILRKCGMHPQEVVAFNGNLGITSRKTSYNPKKLRITLISGRFSNFPWGTGNFIHRALKKLGHDILDIDFRRDAANVPELLEEDTDLLLAYKAPGINPRLLELKSAPLVLWYPDDVLSIQHACDDVQRSGYAYDYIYYFDQAGIPALQKIGLRHIQFLPLATDPEIYSYQRDTPKKYDLVFIGNIYPNRRKLIERLHQKYNLLVTKAYMQEMVDLFNSAKIVLNLGIGSTGYQLRVFEALGCKSFLLTNEIPEEYRLFQDKVHLVYFNEKNIEDLIDYYLEHEEEREAIAEKGYQEVLAKHTFRHRVEKILQDAGFAVDGDENTEVEENAEVKEQKPKIHINLTSESTTRVQVETAEPDVFFQKAKECIEAKEFEKAQEYLANCLYLNPEHSAAWELHDRILKPTLKANGKLTGQPFRQKNSLVQYVPSQNERSLSVLFITPPGLGNNPTPETIAGMELAKLGHDVTIIRTQDQIEIPEKKFDIIHVVMHPSAPAGWKAREKLKVPIAMHLQGCPWWRIGLDDPEKWGYDAPAARTIRQEIPKWRAYYKNLCELVDQADYQDAGCEWHVRAAEELLGKQLRYPLRGAMVDLRTALASNSEIEEQYKIVTISRLVPDKMVHHIAEALKLLDDPPFWSIIGYGPEQERIESILKGSKVKYEFLGPLYGKRKFDEIRSAMFGVYIRSNVPQAEGLCVDRPSLTYYSYVRQVWNDDIVLYARFGDIEDLAAKMQYFIDHPEERHRRAKIGKEKLLTGKLLIKPAEIYAKIIEQISLKILG